MAIERVVGSRQQKAEFKATKNFFDAAFLHPTMGPNEAPKPPVGEIIPPVTGEIRTDLLNAASQMLTKPEKFTTADVFSFADTMQKIAGSVIVDEGESVVAVPDIIPKTGVAEIAVHQRIGRDGGTINVVYRAVGDSSDTRYVLGENFARGSNFSTKTNVQIGSSRPHPYTTNAEMQTIQLDPEEHGKKICEDLFVAHLAKAGRIEPSQAGVVREKLHEGTPITRLEPAK